MSLKNLLEEFPADAGKNDVASAVEEQVKAQLDAVRAEGYEAGYASGWEDAIAAERKKRSHINAELERCVQELGFSYHEATDQLRKELTGFLTDLVEALFPGILTDVLRETLREEITELAEGHLSPSVKLVTSAESADQLRDIMPNASVDIAFEVEPSLGPNQAFLTLAGQERVIDFQPLIDTMRRQLRATAEGPDIGGDDE
ncbi:MAG: hypothetical protein AAF762_01810 [Pseudomonadota bacterium]